MLLEFFRLTSRSCGVRSLLHANSARVYLAAPLGDMLVAYFCRIFARGQMSRFCAPHHHSGASLLEHLRLNFLLLACGGSDFERPCKSLRRKTHGRRT